MFEQIVAHAAGKEAEVAEQVVVEMTTSERLTEMVVCTVIGIATVFLILMLFWGMLELMHKIFDKTEKKKAAKVQSQTEVQKPVQNSLATQSAASIADDTQLVAVLTAAVACMLEAQGAPQTKFKIKSFRRTN